MQYLAYTGALQELWPMNDLYSTVQKSIELRDVYEELINISHKWFDLGLRLELEEGKLETIELANHNKPQHCLRAMLSTWLKQDSRPRWQFLCAALRSKTVGENNLVNDRGKVHMNRLQAMLV